MAKNATREMTSGSPLKLILSFAVPLLLGMLFQQRTTSDCENLSQTQPGCPSHSQLL